MAIETPETGHATAKMTITTVVTVMAMAVTLVGQNCRRAGGCGRTRRAPARDRLPGCGERSRLQLLLRQQVQKTCSLWLLIIEWVGC